MKEADELLSSSFSGKLIEQMRRYVSTKFTSYEDGINQPVLHT